MKTVGMCNCGQKLTLKFRTLSLLHNVLQRFGVLKLHVNSIRSVFTE